MYLVQVNPLTEMRRREIQYLIVGNNRKEIDMINLSPTEPSKHYMHIFHVTFYLVSNTDNIMRGNQFSSHFLHLPPYILQAETPTSKREKNSLTNLIALNDSGNNPNVFALVLSSSGMSTALGMDMAHSTGSNLATYKIM